MKLTYYPSGPRVGPAEGGVRNGHVEALVGQADDRLVVLRIEHRPGLQGEAGGTAALGEGDGDGAEFGPLRVARGDDDAGRVVAHHPGDAGEVRTGVQEH